MGESIRRIRKKDAHEDPKMRELLDRGLTADEIEGIEIVKSASGGSLRRATDVVKAGLLDHPDPEIRRGAAQILQQAGITKQSPLIDAIASRVRPGTPPATQPLTATGGRGVGHQDTSPAGDVHDIDHIHPHWHEGSAEDRGPYRHMHPHDHPIRHDPDDPDDVASHDYRDHLNDPRHTKENSRASVFGPVEAKSVGQTIDATVRDYDADSRRVRKLADGMASSHIDRLARERIGANAEVVRTLKMSAEIAELRKTARPTHSKRVAASTVPVVVKRANAETAKRRAMADIAKRQAPALKLADELVALYPLLEHPDFSIRKGAQELRAQKLAELQNLGRTDVTKAYGSMSDVSTEEIARTVRAEVDKALNRRVS